MPLVTAADFPGINATPDNSGLAEGIFQALHGVGQRAEQRRVENAALLKEQLKITGDQFAFVAGIKDFKTQKRQFAKIAANAAAKGLDTKVFEEGMDIENKEKFNLYLARASLNLGRGLQEVETAVLGKGAKLVDKATGEEIASNTEDTTPSTDIGKARADLDAGLITQEDFDAINSAPPEFQSSIGKLISDKRIAVNAYGEGSPQVQSIQAAIDSDVAGEGPKLTDIAGIRKEFTKQSGDFIKMRDAFNKIQSASDTGAGDVSLIFSFMKIIDPGSTVREGEFATAEQTAGVPTRITNLYNKAVDGDRLGNEQREAFKSEAQNLFDAQKQTQIQLETVFNGLAERQNIDPRDVTLDFIGDVRNQLPQPAKKAVVIDDLTVKDLKDLSDEELSRLAE